LYSQIYETMCTYTLTFDDKLMEKVRPSFANDTAMKTWLQNQIEVLLIQYIGDVKSYAQKNQPKLSERLRGIGKAPEGFDYKKELASRFE